MCVIAVNKSKSLLSEETLNNCWNNNPDGAGIMYAIDNKLYVYKTMKKHKLIKKYKEIREKYPDIDIVLHFRLATHGSVNIDNVHPVVINKDIAFVHNGIISEVMHTSFALEYKDYSDTRIFGKMIEGIADKIFVDKGLQELLESYIGHSKIVFMNNYGEILTLNKSYGVYDREGNWFSNNTYQYNVSKLWSLNPIFRKSNNKYKGYRVLSNQFDFDELYEHDFLDEGLLEGRNSNKVNTNSWDWFDRTLY
jgi:glutamine amidotransferase